METKIKYIKKPKLKNPVLIEGLPGVGNVGRVAISYLIDKLKAKKFAELVSPYFFPLVVVNSDNQIQPLKMEFYHYRAKNKDLVFLVGDLQPVEYVGYYKICERILDFCEKQGIERILTLGGFGIGVEKPKPKVLGALTHKDDLNKYKKAGLYFQKENSIGSIFGISGLLLGQAQKRDIRGCAMLGETIGYPIITDPKAAEEIIKVLMKMFGFKVDLKDLEKNVKQLENFLKNIEDKTKQMSKQLQKPKNYSEYIG